MDTIKIYICYLHLSRHCNNPEGRERDPASQTGRRLHQDTCQWEGRSWSSYTREGTRGSAHSVAKHRPVWLRISRLDTKYHHFLRCLTPWCCGRLLRTRAPCRAPRTRADTRPRDLTPGLNIVHIIPETNSSFSFLLNTPFISFQMVAKYSPCLTNGLKCL